MGQEPGALVLSLALAKAGTPVCLVEPDPDDFARLSDMVPRLLGPARKYLTLSRTVPSGQHVLFSAAPGAVFGTDWTAAAGAPAIRFSRSVIGPDLIEHVGAPLSNDLETIASALQADILHLPAGSIPVAARLHAALGALLEQALLTWSSPTDLDAALCDHGFAIGPFALHDKLGIDDLLAERQVVETRLGMSAHLPLFPRAVSEGRLGRKTSVGWHRYPGQGGAVEDPLVEDMAEEEARFAGWDRIERSDDAAASEIASKMDHVIRDLARDMCLSLERVERIAEQATGYRSIAER